MIIKKEVLLFVFTIFVILNCYNARAALGMMPALIETDFEPGLKFSVNFQVSGADANQELKVYAIGDLAEYVTFDKTELKGQESFTAYVDLPGNVDKPGKNRLYIRVAEVADAEAGIGTRIEIGALILIKVPYPGQYAEIKSFNVYDVNSEEPVNFNAGVESLGHEEIVVSARVKVENEERLINDIFLGTKTIKNQTSESFEKIVKEGYKSGLYNATLIVDYGKVINQTIPFKVGKLFVDIINYSSKFKQGKINEFNIEIESKWNSNLQNVYAEVNVTKDGKQVDYFKTPSVYLEKWTKANLKGFFNAENLETGNYNAKITLFYENEKTEKTANIKVIVPEQRILIIKIIIISVVIILIIIVIITYFYFRKKGKKSEK